MKTVKYFSALAILALAMFAANSCAKPDQEAIHSDNTIQSIRISRISGQGGESIGAISGVINQETGEIYFMIPSRAMVAWTQATENFTKVKVDATVGLDVFISPSLSGLKDLNSPLNLTVTSGTGVSRTYTLFVEEEI